VTTKDQLVILGSRIGGVSALHSHPNQLEYTGINDTTHPVEDGAIDSDDAKAFENFHRPKNKTPYHKPQRLVDELIKLFNERLVLDEIGAQKRLGDMRNDDGSLLFCYSKRGEVKKYPNISRDDKNWISGLEIKDYFKTQAAKRRKG
jgi:hypothetical protein